MSPAKHAELLAAFRAEWPRALEAWSAYTLLREPRFFETNAEARSDGMAGEIAAIRLRDHTVMVNVAEIVKRGLEGHALPILAHEIGHHVYVPGNLTDNGRMIAAMSRMLQGLPKDTVHLVANLYGDLLINDRLQHRVGLDIAGVYVKLKQRARKGKASNVWAVYSRTYEHLWRLPAGTLAPEDITEEMDADAMLLARIVRSFAGDWLRGARRVATVLYRYLAQDQLENKGQTFVELGLHDTGKASAGAPGDESSAVPDGLASIDPSELEDDDGFDDEIANPLGRRERQLPKARNTEPSKDGQGRSGGQYRQPFEYGELLKSLGLQLSEHEITTRYYRERALPHLIPFPSRRTPQATEPLAEGYSEWNAGDPLEALDLFGSILQSPRVVPGVTTVQRTYADVPGNEVAKVPMDLDIYVDCSGSMPNPAVEVSYLSLCATILALSALRVGARVQATLWSSAGTFETTGGFLRDEKRVLGTVTGYVSGGTAFPIHLLRDTYQDRKASQPPAHIVVISDDGCDTMLNTDEHGNDGATVAAMALGRARGGGTLVLNLADLNRWQARAPLEKIGYRVHAVRAWEDLVVFARAFVHENYGEKS